jgi:hypothetical protein
MRSIIGITLTVSALAAAGSALGAVRPGGRGPAAGPEELPRVAILDCTYNFGPPNRTTVITYDGSSGSPDVPIGSSCAEALALLMADGFALAEVDEGDDAVQFVGYLLVDARPSGRAQ